jgi:hypothetical protein
VKGAPALNNVFDACQLKKPGGPLLDCHLLHDALHLLMRDEQPSLLVCCCWLNLCNMIKSAQAVHHYMPSLLQTDFIMVNRNTAYE